MTHAPAARRAAVGIVVVIALLGACTSRGGGASGTRAGSAVQRTGVLPDGATWAISVPKGWTGTLVLYSHGLVQPGQANPAHLAPNDEIATALLAAGYALAASSYKTTGWALEDALADQTDLLGVFAREVRPPVRTIAYGASLGGLITATLLERAADHFDGGLAVCGVLAGTVPLWNSLLDPFFVLATLLPDLAVARPLVHTPTGDVQATAVRAGLQRAAATPGGQARLALAAAIAGFPPQITVDGRATPASDLSARGFAEAVDLSVLTLVAFGPRAELEARAGGNPSSNVGVDYAALLRGSAAAEEVAARYTAAGLSLDGDLAALAAAPRIAADPDAVRYANEFAEPTGTISKPLLTVNDLGDVLALPGYARAYADTVAAAGRAYQLGQAWLQRGGHCTMTPAEVVAAMGAVVARIDAGRWGGLDAASALDAAAERVGPAANVLSDPALAKPVPSAPAFVAHEQPPLPSRTGT